MEILSDDPGQTVQELASPCPECACREPCEQGLQTHLQENLSVPGTNSSGKCGEGQ